MYKPNLKLSKTERLKRFYKDLFYESPKDMLTSIPKDLPKHYPTVHKLKSGKIIVHIPKSWRDEWKMWSGPTTQVWGKKGIEMKQLKKFPLSRREMLEDLGIVGGMAVPLVLAGTTMKSGSAPMPLMYAMAASGKYGGDRLEDLLERMPKKIQTLKRKERELMKKLGAGAKRLSPIEVT